ncbi:hypothetical protein L1987_47714 [Smallanthus sonchifolius]|uniref:Uncharacterized protein n=1 Tax=Smallanthus sonchifolius TaxID=185202 RepID=A0ACB9G4F1_9ASTR|nr:hypothetical protein L1987_47714 [Smallanthus sonchifolius]
MRILLQYILWRLVTTSVIYNIIFSFCCFVLSAMKVVICSVADKARNNPVYMFNLIYFFRNHICRRSRYHAEHASFCLKKSQKESINEAIN